MNALVVRSGFGARTMSQKDVMKKHITACLLAIPLATAGLPEARAWFKFTVGAGANVGVQSGGSKNFLWGVCKSNDTPLVGGSWQGAPPNNGPFATPAGSPFGGPGMDQLGAAGGGNQFAGPGM